LASKNNKKDNKNKKKINTKKESYAGFIKSRNFKWTVIGIAIIVVIVLVAVFNPFFEPPASIHPDTYYKVSDGDLLSNGSSAVFFLSWIGCPIGATDSWAIYSAINSTSDIYSHVALHTADPKDIYSNGVVGQPGLLFKNNFTFTTSGHKFTFYPLYMYNQTMTGTVNNTTINGTLASYGLSLINETYPAKVAAMFNRYAADITDKGHLETTFIITGPHGTYILNAFMYDPGATLGTPISPKSPEAGYWSPNSPQYVWTHLSESKNIKDAAGTFSGYLAKAK
jgi:hypothetical protein